MNNQKVLLDRPYTYLYYYIFLGFIYLRYYLALDSLYFLIQCLPLSCYFVSPMDCFLLEFNFMFSPKLMNLSSSATSIFTSKGLILRSLDTIIPHMSLGLCRSISVYVCFITHSSKHIFHTTNNVLMC